MKRPRAKRKLKPPAQEPLRPLGVATASPEGKVSVKLTPVNATVLLGFLIVNVREVLPFTGRVAAPNNFVIGRGPTKRVADAVPPIPWLDVTFPVVLR